MKSHEIGKGNVVDEVAMNPGSFAQSVAQGTKQGVLVGFEFEVLVPESTLKRAPKETKSKELVSDLERDNDNIAGDTGNMENAKKFDQYFKSLGNTKHPSAVAAHKAIAAGRVAEIKEIFLSLPEKIRAEIRGKLEAKYKNSPHERDRQILRDPLKFAHAFAYYLDDKRGFSYQAYQMGRASYITMYKLLVEYTGDDEWTLLEYFDFNPDKVYDAYDFDYHDDYYDDDYQNYSTSAKVLKPALEQTMGATVNVFSEYHQRRKNMTDWYIEPDGSLEPEDDDGLAEIVGPPEPAEKAIDSLKKFYAMAKQLKLYTNDSTGCHINVSIPQNVDLLKLALFLGDTHVLRQFGREFNDYARSALRGIEATAGDPYYSRSKPMTTPRVTGMKKVFKQQPATAAKINYDLLQRIAKDVTRQHTASISNSGNYISFRHAGGDYLNQYQDVFNVVGRFVRAMVIASDPNAYRQEYLKMVAKLAQTTFEPTEQSKIAEIQRNGMSGYKIHLWRVKPVKFTQMLGDIVKLSKSNPDNGIPNSQEAKQKIIADRPIYKGERVAARPLDEFATFTVIPNDKYLDNFVSSADSVYDVGNKGFYAVERVQIPPSDPRVQQYVLELRKDAQGL